MAPSASRRVIAAGTIGNALECYDFGRSYLGIERFDGLVTIRITANDTRPAVRKQAFYKRIAERLAVRPGVRPQDVLISLVGVSKENWSIGMGIAQYA